MLEIPSESLYGLKETKPNLIESCCHHHRRRRRHHHSPRHQLYSIGVENGSQGSISRTYFQIRALESLKPIQDYVRK